jgi:hypothetical protein
VPGATASLRRCRGCLCGFGEDLGIAASGSPFVREHLCRHRRALARDRLLEVTGSIGSWPSCFSTVLTFSMIPIRLTRVIGQDRGYVTESAAVWDAGRVALGVTPGTVPRVVPMAVRHMTWRETLGETWRMMFGATCDAVWMVTRTAIRYAICGASRRMIRGITRAVTCRAILSATPTAIRNTTCGAIRRAISGTTPPVLAAAGYF